MRIPFASLDHIPKACESLRFRSKIVLKVLPESSDVAVELPSAAGTTTGCASSSDSSSPQRNDARESCMVTERSKE